MLVERREPIERVRSRGVPMLIVRAREELQEVKANSRVVRRSERVGTMEVAARPPVSKSIMSFLKGNPEDEATFGIVEIVYSRITYHHL